MLPSIISDLLNCANWLCECCPVQVLLKWGSVKDDKEIGMHIFHAFHPYAHVPGILDFKRKPEQLQVWMVCRLVLRGASNSR
jgi:hypothetical protein